MRQCDGTTKECQYYGEIKYSLFDIIVERLTLMILTGNTPMHLINVKLAMFSKNGTSAVKGPQEIRPIGVLPIFYKIMEKAFKNIIDDQYPEMFEVQMEQAGFQKGRSVLDHTTMLMQRIVNNQQQNRMWVLIDMTSAYDNVKHDLLLQILTKRAQGFKMKIGQSGQTIQHPLATLFLQFLRKSYDFNTMTIGPHLIRLNQGLIQGGGLSPPLFNIYIQEMFQEDQIINQKNENYRTIVQYWNKHRQIPHFSDSLDINCAFADDDIMETNEQELQEWDYKRLPVWNKYGMTLNTKTKILVKKYPQNRKKIHLEASNLDIEIVTSAKYLGTQLNPQLFKDRSDKAAENYIQYITDRLKIVKMLTKPQHQYVSMRTQQIYFDSLYRFLVTPYVVTNLITIEQALEIWRIISKKVHKLPQSMEKELQMCLIPQPDLVTFWYKTLEKLVRRTPIYEYKEVKYQLEKAIKMAEQADLGEYFDGYKKIATMVMNTNYKPSYVTGMPLKELEKQENHRDPEWLCIGCLQSFVVTKNQRLETGDYIYQYQMESDHNKNTEGILEAFTDSSHQKDQYGKNYAAIGVYIPKLNRRIAKQVIVRKEIIDKKLKKQLGEGLTNNVAELMAVLEAIQQIENYLGRNKIKNLQKVVIRSDSKYTVSVVNEYLQQWIKENRLANKNIELIVRIKERLKLAPTKIGVPIELQHTRAHQHITNMEAYYNHIADYLADTALTGITKAPRIKVVIPKAETHNPKLLCSVCRIKWYNSSFQEKIKLVQFLRTTIKRNTNIKQVQEEIKLFETKFQVNSNVELQKRIRASKFTQFINQAEEEEKMDIDTQINYNNDALTGQPYAPNNKQIKFYGITMLEAKQKDNKLYQLLAETDNMTVKQKQELAENIALGEKAQNSTYNEIVARFLKHDEVSNINPQLIHTQPTIKGAVRKLLNDKRNATKIRLLESILKEKLDQQYLSNCDRFIKAIKVKRTNFEEIAHQGIALRYSLIFNSEKDLLIKNIQWNLPQITTQIKKDYTDHLPTIIEAFRIAKGFTANGVIICKICKQKPIQLIRGSITHLMRCNKETVEKLNKRFEEEKLTDREKAVSKAMILNLTNRHQLLEDAYILYHRVKENLINPSLIKHLSGVIAWSKSMMELHQNNLGRDITAILTYSEFEEANTKKPNKRLQKDRQEDQIQLEEDDQLNVIESLAQQSIKIKLQKLEEQAKRSNLQIEAKNYEFFEQILEKYQQQINYVKEKVPLHVIKSISMETFQECIIERRRKWKEAMEKEIYNISQENPHHVQIIYENQGRGHIVQQLCKAATQGYMKSKKTYNKVLARAERNAKFHIKKLTKAQNQRLSKLDFAEINKTNKFMKDSHQQAQNIETQARPILQIFQTTHVTNQQESNQSNQPNFTTTQQKHRFKTKPNKDKDLRQAQPIFNIQRPPNEELRAIKAARSKLINNSTLTYSGIKSSFLDHLLQPFEPITKNILKAMIFRKVHSVEWKKLRNNVRDHKFDMELTQEVHNMIKINLADRQIPQAKRNILNQQLHHTNSIKQALSQESTTNLQLSQRTTQTLSNIHVSEISADERQYGIRQPPTITRTILNPEEGNQNLPQFTLPVEKNLTRFNGQNLAHFLPGSQEHKTYLLEQKPKPQGIFTQSLRDSAKDHRNSPNLQRE